MSISTFKPFSLLVTGAPGWLADAVLTRLGDALPALTRVRCLVHAGHPDESIAAWRRLQPSVTEILRGDLLEAECWDAACEQMRGGVVLHTAAIFHPQHPQDWFALNRDAAVHLAERARSAGARRFVFVSSIAAQGASNGGTPLTEEMACHPYSDYGRSKLEAEEAILRLHTPGGFETVVLRPSEFYGPPVPPHQLDLFENIAAGSVRLVGGGRVIRSLSYIDDVADGVVAALHHPKAAGTVFNLCDARSYSEREIVEAIAEALGATAQISSLPAVAARAANFAYRALLRFERYAPALRRVAESHWDSAASCVKAQQILGYAPKVELKEGMLRAVAWARAQNLMD